MIENLYFIDSGYFRAGIVTRLGVVIKAPPIVDYMKGWLFQAVEVYCKKKKWKLEQIISK